MTSSSGQGRENITHHTEDDREQKLLETPLKGMAVNCCQALKMVDVQ